MEDPFKDVAKAFKEFNKSLHKLSLLFREIDKENEKAYKQAGYPFGTSTEAFGIWCKYCEFTTTN